ncbi:hypothetical protein VHUM_03382 [Vanrija humicola]|uniref:Major facilitator superfamily (MFS) profile domain-containing protein n=1 Tax=Vanrija humicola TaxID=5417 RepID=A0A7D8V3N7_VANHU|nr:hypothetical protein VHUM_03382 [Vanrija humicola]
MDKTSLTQGVIFGLREDTNMTDQEYANLTTLFYMAYAVAQFPFTWIMQRFPIGKALSVFVILWGACVMCLGACNNYAQLAAVRVLVGAFEAVVIPGFVILTSAWYLRKEQTFRQCLYYSQNQVWGIVASVAVYFMARAVANSGGIAGWRVIQFFMGGLTILCGIFDLLLIGTPDEVWWLKKDDKAIAKARIVTNATGGAEVASWRWDQVKECFTDPQYYFSVLFNFLVMVPNGAYITFNTLLMRSMGFDPFEVILYSMPSQAIAIFFVLVPGLCVQYYPKTRFPWALFVTALATASFLFVGLTPADTPKWTKWGVYIFALPFATAMFLIWPLMSINVAGRTKKTWLTASALVAYSAGNILGSQIFRDPPRYVRGLIGVSIAMILYMVLFVVWWWYYVRENRRRDRVVAEMGLTPEEEEAERRKAGEQDMTDVQVGGGVGSG